MVVVVLLLLLLVVVVLLLLLHRQGLRRFANALSFPASICTIPIHSTSVHAV